MKTRAFILIWTALSVCWAQNTPAPAPGRGEARGMFGPPAVKSPEVAPDGKVTFRLRAPGAREVSVTGVARQPLAMEKDDQGVWTLTTGVLDSDIYDYHFQIDGITVTDPGIRGPNPRMQEPAKACCLCPGRTPGRPHLTCRAGRSPAISIIPPSPKMTATTGSTLRQVTIQSAKSRTQSCTFCTA